MGVAVGIDLGTTNSCVAVVQADRARVVADPVGRRIHPSGELVFVLSSCKSEDRY